LGLIPVLLGHSEEVLQKIRPLSPHRRGEEEGLGQSLKVVVVVVSLNPRGGG